MVWHEELLNRGDQMNITVEYTRDDIEKMVLERHAGFFGRAPVGEKWKCINMSYGEIRVENCPDNEEADGKG